MRKIPWWMSGVLAALISSPTGAGDRLALADTPAAEVEPAKEETAPSPSVSDKIKDPKLRKHLLENIDVFGKSEMPAIYILAPGLEDYEGFLLVRDFSSDPFFMQNVDREEFEMKTSLRDFHEEDEKDKEKKGKDLR